MAIPIADLKVGSVVRLLSGSPKMGVLSMTADGQVECLWWSDRLGVCSDRFPAELLTWPRSDALAGPAEGDDA